MHKKKCKILKYHDTNQSSFVKIHSQCTEKWNLCLRLYLYEVITGLSVDCCLYWLSHGVRCSSIADLCVKLKQERIRASEKDCEMRRESIAVSASQSVNILHVLFTEKLLYRFFPLFKPVQCKQYIHYLWQATLFQ